MDPLPYNVTISSQTGTIQYLPIRAGDAALGWNVTYSLGTKDTGYGNLQGIGVDVHQTTHDGATMQFSWIGTAVYLYGHASGASYTLDVDGEQTSSSSVNIPQGGVLGSRTGLNYGNHTLTLTNHGIGQLAFQYAELTVGMGYPGTSIQNNTILAVDTDPVSYNPTPNPFFTYHPEYNHWGIQDAKSQLLPSGILVPVPLQMLTPTLGEAMSFTVNQTSAFFLYGSSNNNRDAKTVTITPFSDPSKARTTIVNDYSSLLDFFQIIYWEAGLDRDESYNVQLIQTGIPPGNPSGSPNFGFYSLVTVDGGSALSSQTSGTGDQHQSSTKLRTGLIVGTVSGVVLLLIAIGAVFWVWRRRKIHHFASRRPPLVPKFKRISWLPTNHALHDITLPSPPLPTAVPIDPDDPVDIESLPPAYQPHWVNVRPTKARGLRSR